MLVQFLNRVSVKIADTGNRSRHPGQEFPSGDLLHAENQAERNDSSQNQMEDVLEFHFPDNDGESHHQPEEDGAGVAARQFKKEDDDHRGTDVEHYLALLG